MEDIPDTLSAGDKEVVEDVVEAHGYSGLTETQAMAFREGALDPGNSLLMAPTGNGKTLVAKAVAKKAVDNGGTVAYLTPTTQLRNAKQDELDETLDAAIGSKASSLGRASVTVLTFESFFQGIMRDLGRCRELDVAIFDDFHELYSSHRGAKIEQAMSACLYESIGVFAMSATVGNPDTLARWLDADLILSNSSRSVPIEELPQDRGQSKSVQRQIADLIEEEDRGPYLVFNRTRSLSESRAESIGENTSLGAADRDFYTEIENALSAEMTDKYETLAKCMNNGVAFHHSGLSRGVRSLIVDAIKEGDIECVSATSGLAYGFDAPIRSVIVASFRRRYDYIGVYEYVQWIGRAGRGESYDHDRAFAYPMYKDEEVPEKFQFGTPPTEKDLEPVKTKIDTKAERRLFALTLVNFGWRDIDDIVAYFEETLYGECFGNDSPSGISFNTIEMQIRDTLDWLVDRGFVEYSNATGLYEPTNFGRAAVEFNYSSWVDTEPSAIRNFYDVLPDIYDDPVHLIRELSDKFMYSLRTPPESQEVINLVREAGLYPDEDAITAVVLYHYWGRGKPLDKLEDSIGGDLSDVPSTGYTASRLLSGVDELVKAHPDAQQQRWYETLAKQLDDGIAPTDLALAESVNGLGREKVRTLKNRLEELMQTRDLEIEGTIVDGLETYIEDVGRNKAPDVFIGQVDGIGKELAPRIVSAVVDGSAKEMDPALWPPGFDVGEGADQDEMEGGIDEGSSNDQAQRTIDDF